MQALQTNDASSATSNALAPTAAAAAADPQSTTDASAVDFQNFLQLLTAQLRNQDPLSPLDSTQFIAQLASFSTVEQLVKSNTSLDQIASAILGDGLTQYADWIGAEAEIPFGEINFDGAPAAFRIEPLSAADQVQASVRNANGEEVHRFTIANNDHEQSWNGATQSGVAPEGAYTITAVYSRDGEIIAEGQAHTFDLIQEVRLGADGPQLWTEHGRVLSPDEVIGLRSVTPVEQSGG